MSDSIQYIAHAEIDKSKWDDCISNACNSLIYAKSIYLDAMSPGWDALVMGDYEAIMPVTWRTKMGIRYLCQPAFIQQLGIFYKHASNRECIPGFLRKLSVGFKLVEIYLNYDNHTEGITATHQNFILPLKNTYDAIADAYKNDLVKNLNRTKKFNLQYIKTGNVKSAIEQYQYLYAQRMNIRDIDFTAFTKLAETLMVSGNAFVREVQLSNGKLLAIGLFLKDETRIYNIASSTLPDGRTFEANHFLMDQLIREFAGSGLLLDFEGSDLQGVARFYNKFSPVNQPYYFWKTNRLPAVLKWLKK